MGESQLALNKKILLWIKTIMNYRNMTASGGILKVPAMGVGWMIAGTVLNH